MIKDAFLQSLVQINCIPVLIIIFLIFFLQTNYTYEKEITRKFIPSVLLLLALILVDNLDYYAYDALEVTGFFDTLHRLFAMLGYDIRIILMASLISVASDRVFGHKHTVLITYLPALINVAIMIPCLFTDLFFYYNPDGSIGRGIFAFEPHILSGVYMLFLFALGIICKKKGRVGETGILLLCGLLTIFGFLAEFLFALRGILIGVVALDITFYYLYLHIEHFRFDSLTEIFNRDAFMADIEKYGRTSASHLISVDLNDLKKLNDKRGHTEGDKALKAVARSLQDSCLKECFAYRVGGDEFAVLCIGKTNDQVNEMTRRMRESVNAAGYVCAIGYTEWKRGETFKEVYRRADETMYNNKRELKALKAGTGNSEKS